VSAITDVRARLVRVALDPPAAFSTRLLRHREYVLVSVRDSDGAEGIGYTYAGDQGGSLVAEAVRNLIAPLVIGQPAGAVEDNWALCFQELLLVGRRGGVIRALSAVDIACWDLIARRRGEPLHHMLGTAADSVPAYASGGYYRTPDHLGDIREQIEHYRRQGFTDYKIKFGRLLLREDVARVALARELIGPDARLALDINNGWSNVAQAMAALHALADHDIWWIEEPFTPDDVSGHAELARRSPTPIATAEIEATRWGFAQLIERRAAHILQPDACVAGGITEFLKIAHAAEAFSVPIAPHWHANLHAPLVAALSAGMTVEYFDPALDIFNFDRLVCQPVRIAHGRIALSSDPGIGVSFDEAAVDRWEVR